MLRIDRVAKTFAQLPERKLSEAGILERHDIQAMIVASPDAFFGELRENIKLLAQEFRPDDVVDDRIDLLGTDEDGTAVIIELKRGNHRMHLLQALSYAEHAVEVGWRQVCRSRCPICRPVRVADIGDS